jgi:hypothetical protein
MNQSTQLNLENAIAKILFSVSNVNVYTANRVGGRLFPYITIQASINSQLLGNYTGVYDLNVLVNYSDTADKITQEDFDSKYCDIFNAFYEQAPSLVIKIQNVISNTKVFMARIVSQTPSIRTDKDAWQRGLTLNIFATPSELDDGLRSLRFFEEQNSMYVAII